MRMADNESSAQPVGLEYIEEDRSGKVIQFHCKLCDCKFNDPNAKEMHLKGRRHRLQYKKKVDPSLDVDVKPSIRARRVQDERSRQQRVDLWRRRELDERMQEMQAMENANYWNLRPTWSQSRAPNPSYSAPGSQQYPYQRNTGTAAGGSGAKRVETVDDKHVQAKHASIYPSEEELRSVQHLVSSCEKALKLVSDHLAEECSRLEAEKEQAERKTNGQVDPSTPAPLHVLKTPVTGKTRQLRGVVRAGPLANGLMLHHDLNVELVLLSAMQPCVSFVHVVHENFVKQLKVVAPDDNFEVHLNIEGCGLIVLSTKQPVTTCSIVFTSPSLRENEECAPPSKKKPLPTEEKDAPPNNGNVDSETDEHMTDSTLPSDLLDKDKCLAALADLRHAKWFQAKCSGRQTIVVIIRVMRDLCSRVPTWSPLGQWPLELLVEKVISSGSPSIGLGEALRRLFECIASGTFLTEGPGLLDPCEKEAVDALEYLSPQEREDITASAQHALRLIAFRQIHKVLDMEPLPPPGYQQRGKSGNSPDTSSATPGEKRSGDSKLSIHSSPATPSDNPPPPAKRERLE